jgi:ABC-type multidrug transport system fused ATPase/permease subunit
MSTTSVNTATRAAAAASPLTPVSSPAAGAAVAVVAKAKEVIRPRIGMLSIVLSLVGACGVIAAVAAQAFAIDHGSNQKPIDANNITAVWSIILGLVILAVGVVLWFHFSGVTGEYRYLYVYLLAFMSYIVASIALYMSTIQVIVRESTN